MATYVLPLYYMDLILARCKIAVNNVIRTSKNETTKLLIKSVLHTVMPFDKNQNNLL